MCSGPAPTLELTNRTGRTDSDSLLGWTADSAQHIILGRPIFPFAGGVVGYLRQSIRRKKQLQRSRATRPKSAAGAQKARTRRETRGFSCRLPRDAPMGGHRVTTQHCSRRLICSSPPRRGTPPSTASLPPASAAAVRGPHPPAARRLSLRRRLLGGARRRLRERLRGRRPGAKEGLAFPVLLAVLQARGGGAARTGPPERC